MADDGWLSDDEQDAWRALVRCVEFLQQGLDRQLQRDAGLPHAYYGILVVLSEAPDRTARMSDLAGLLAYSPSRLSHAVARMESLGWIVRRPCDRDRRITYASLTDAGAGVLAEAAPAHVAFVRRHVMAPLDVAQRDALRDACLLIVDSLVASGELDPVVLSTLAAVEQRAARE